MPDHISDATRGTQLRSDRPAESPFSQDRTAIRLMTGRVPR
jgi:hypothetical protein